MGLSSAILLDVDVDGRDLSRLLPLLASLPELFWIEEVLPIRPHNDVMKGILQSGNTSMRPLFDRGLTGVGQILGQSDSGVDVNHCFFLDPNFSVVFEEVDGGELDTCLVEADDEEGVFLARFDMDRIRDYRARETWGNAYRKPRAYWPLTDAAVSPPFIRPDARR